MTTLDEFGLATAASGSSPYDCGDLLRPYWGDVLLAAREMILITRENAASEALYDEEQDAQIAETKRRRAAESVQGGRDRRQRLVTLKREKSDNDETIHLGMQTTEATERVT